MTIKKKKAIFSKIMVLVFLSMYLLSSPTLHTFSEPTRLPRIVVFNGNGAYHTFIEGFKANASNWGYEVLSTTSLSNAYLEYTEILILNAPDFLSIKEQEDIKSWWNSGNKSIWIVGESDYGGYWNPECLNNLSVKLGLNVIIQDDALSDPISQDGASYRVLANISNPSWNSNITSGVDRITLHGPTVIAPYSGDLNGINSMPSWENLPYTDWIVNSSGFAAVQDQDGDDDAYWEGYPTLTNGSWTVAAVEWNTGPYNQSKAIWTGESIFADYKDMFGYKARYVDKTIQNIELTRNLIEWAFKKVTIGVNYVTIPKLQPTVYVWSGNGAFHTSVSGFVNNATAWGYKVYESIVMNESMLQKADILIVNAPHYLMESDSWLIKKWWELNNRTLWIAGESDYGGYWYPNTLNELIVDIGGHVIIVDDAISDSVSQDGASYRVIANVTNPTPTFDNILRDWSPNVQNIPVHGPTHVAPWNGTRMGDRIISPEGVISWDQLPNADWIINTSKHATIQDQDGDDDSVWEGDPPLTQGSYAMVAAEWDIGPYGGSKLVVSGESFFADFKEMFDSLTARYVDNIAYQTINFTRGLLNWSIAQGQYFEITDNLYPPTIRIINDNTHLSIFGDIAIYDFENFSTSFSIYDYPDQPTALSNISIFYGVDSLTNFSAPFSKIGGNLYTATFGPFSTNEKITYTIYVEDADGFSSSITGYFGVESLDNIEPSISGFSISPWPYIGPLTQATVSATISDESGVNNVICEYSLDNWVSWSQGQMIASGSFYSFTLPQFELNASVIVRIIANDIAGNQQISENLVFIVTEEPPDTAGPIISELSIFPWPNIDPQTTALVSVTVTDESGVQSVKCVYSTDDGETWVNLSMTPFETNWRVYLPYFALDTTVIAFLIAEDTMGNQRVSEEIEFTIILSVDTSTSEPPSIQLSPFLNTQSLLAVLAILTVFSKKLRKTKN